MDIEKLEKVKDVKILVFGDYIVDKYIFGSVKRISPEAPVPVINYEKSQVKLGGAGNVINNLISLGASVRALGCTGYDEAGNFIYNTFLDKEVDTTFFKQYPEIKTIQKIRVVSKTHQFMRIDEEEVKDLPSSYYLYLKDNMANILEDINAIIISDYAKGAVNKEYASLIIDNAKKKNIPVIVDPKGNDYSKYRGATLCTPNMKEFMEAVKVPVKSEEDILKEGVKLAKALNLKYLIVTRSEKGLSLIENDTKKDFPAKAKEVIDVSGAGDTVISTIGILQALNFDISDTCVLANLAASVVISKFGTSTLTMDELISKELDDTNFKLLDVSTIKNVADELKQKDKKIVFTNGCFDLLHAGHISSFEQAKKMGDILIVAVNSDKSVKDNKGDLRPIISEKDRIKMLCSLEVIDYVVLMDDKTPERLISLIQPDICVKGDDWKGKEIPEKKIIDSYGGELKFIELKKNLSTTKIIERILKVYEKK